MRGHMTGDWRIGVLCSFLGSVFSASGYLLQRYSHHQNAARPPKDRLPPHKQPHNLLGVVFVGVESFFDWLALIFAAESLVASLGTMAVILNAIFAPTLLGEKLQKKDVAITGIAILGTILCVLFSPHSDQELEWKDLEDLLIRPSFVFWALVASVICLFLFLVSRGRVVNPLARVFRSSQTAARYNDLLLRLSLPLLAAFCAAFAGMFSKALGELVVDTINGENQFSSSGPYLMIIVTALFTIMQIRFQNEALGKYEALFVVPIYEVSLALVGILNGEMYYNDLQGFTVTQWIFFPLGIILNMSAVLMLLLRKGSVAPEAIPMEERRRTTSLLKHKSHEHAESNDDDSVYKHHHDLHGMNFDLQEEDNLL